MAFTSPVWNQVCSRTRISAVPTLSPGFLGCFFPSSSSSASAIHAVPAVARSKNRRAFSREGGVGSLEPSANWLISYG